MTDRRIARTGRVLDALLVGVVLGAIALALGGVVRDPAALPADAVAVVNGRAIARSEITAVLKRVGAQLGHEPDAAERAEVLARLIDEELLIQRGLALDLPHGDARLRGQLVQEVMRQALMGVAEQPVDEGQLAAFFAANQAYFVRPAQLRVARYEFPSGTAAQAFRAALDTVATRESVLARHARERSPLVPDALLSEARLGDLVGAESAAGVAALVPGQGLVQQMPGGRACVLVLLDAQAAVPATLDAQRTQVEAEFRRRRDEQAITEYLRRLREEARIVAGG